MTTLQVSRLDGVAAKVETTYATDAAPGTTNGVRVSRRVASVLRVTDQYQNLRDEVANASLTVAPPTSIPAGQIVELDIYWPVRGAGTAYSSSNLPEADPLFQACGLGQVVVTTPGSESVTYTPSDSAWSSATLYAYAGGVVYKVVGCRSTLTLPFSAGTRGIAQFHVRGILSASPIAAAVPAFTYNAQLARPVVSFGLSIGPWTPVFSSFDYVLGADLVTNEDGNSAYGLQVDIAKFVPEFRLRAKAVVPATYDPFADALARTTRTVVGTYGSTQYNRLKFNAANSYLINRSPEEQSQFVGWNLTYRAGAASDAAVKFD